MNRDHPATPGCECERCKAVFAEWAAQAEAFQRWYERFGYRYLRVVRREQP